MSDVHDHEHGPKCGYTAVRHEDRIYYLHDGELHRHEGNDVESHSLAISERNPGDCTPDHDCPHHEGDHEHGSDCGHERVPHGDHVDYLVGGHLHHPHGDHCDDHGSVQLA